MTDYALPITGTGSTKYASAEDHDAEVNRRIDEAVAVVSNIHIPLTITGTADALIGAPRAGQTGLATTGSLITFTPGSDNTAAASITINGVVRNVRDSAGAALAPSVLRAGRPVVALITGATEVRLIGPSQDDLALAGGALTDGTDINTIVKPGMYYGDSTHTYINAPADVAGKQWFLDVRAPEAGTDNLRRWVIQTATASTGMASPYKRRIDGLAPGSTYAWSMVGGGYAGSQTGVTLSTLVSPGLYLIGMTGVADKPEGFAGTTGLLEVRAYGTYVTQTLRYPLEPVTGWVRTVRPGVGVYDWSRLKSAGAGGESYSDARAVFFGDSIVANSDYPARFGDILGMAEVINGGFGGARMGPGGSYNAFSMVSISAAIASSDWSTITAAAEAQFSAGGVDVRPKVATLAALDWNTVDYVCIAYASNDWANGVVIGAAGDTATTTICGSANTAITSLLTAHPHLRLMLITPSWRARQTVGDAKDSDAYPDPGSGEYLIEVVDGIKAVAEKWHVPVCDLYRTQGLNLLTYAEYLRDQTVDGLHPYAATGAQIFADRVASCFKAHF